jgi:3-deoxy-D-manno-octulosonic-acid transferase
MTLGLAAYRGAASLAGAFAPIVRGLGSRQSAWRSAWSGATEDLLSASGSVWVHAASLGEVAAARNWISALLLAGHSPPLLLTTRTTRGLLRARRELGERVVARVAPLDVPQLLGSFLRSAAPWRLDVIETEIWPLLIQECRKHGVAVVFVSAAVSERTRTRLRRWGIAGPRLLGEGVWVLAQSERHAERFRSLGVPSERIAVTGDLKAEAPTERSSRGLTERPAVVFGSLRPGEEPAALAVARSLAPGGGHAFIAAPRHEEGVTRMLEALRHAAMPVSVRREEGRGEETVETWISGLSVGSPRVGILATHGELPSTYESAAVAIVGGTFAPYGGHNALEPAARGCAVVTGPYTDGIEESLASLASEGGLARAKDSDEVAGVVRSLLEDHEKLARTGRGALAAAAKASESARRSLEAIERFGLMP